MFEIGKLKESFPTEEEFRKFFRKVIEVKLPKIEWNPENIVKFIEGCRMSEGIPMFRTGYGGEDFEFAGKKAAMGVCWGGTDTGSFLFVNIPEDEFEELKSRSGDWHILAIRYAPEKYKKLVKYPVRL